MVLLFKGDIHRRKFGSNKEDLPNLKQLKNLLETKTSPWRGHYTLNQRLIVDLLEQLIKNIEELESMS